MYTTFLLSVIEETLKGTVYAKVPATSVLKLLPTEAMSAYKLNSIILETASKCCG